MGADSKIEWTDHTFNPWWGCAHVSPGCVHCYAEAFAKRTGHKVWGAKGPRRTFGEKHWNEPRRWNQQAEREGVRRRVFCASMADVFEDHPALPAEREKLWPLIAETPHLDWLLLTKRPEYVARFAPADLWRDNVWMGTTVEDQQRANERIPILAAIPARTRFLSCEPMVGPVDLEPFHVDTWWGGLALPFDWVICGGESGPQHRPMAPDWARSLRDQCVEAGVAFLFKQWGGRFPKAGGRELDGRTWDEIPQTLASLYVEAQRAGDKHMDGVEPHGTLANEQGREHD